MLSRRGWIIAALALALAGCSALRLAYNQAPTFLYWWFDAYADFDDAQSHAARVAIDDWFDWNRRTQLPDYATLLARAAAEVRQDTTPERACQWWRDIRGRTDLAIDRVLPGVATIATTLTAAQLRHVEQHYAKSNAKFRDEYLDGDRAERLKGLVKRTVERAETLYGALDDAQRDVIAQRLAASPFDPELWYAERLARQRDAMTLLGRIAGDELPREQAIAALRAYAAGWARSPREPYRRYFEQLEQFNCRFAAALHNGTTPAQRQRAADKLRSWEADLRTLIAERR